MAERSMRERLLDMEMNESWAVQAQLAWDRYLATIPGADPIAMERQKVPFITGFIQAGLLPPNASVNRSQCIPLDPNGIIHLSRRILPYIKMFGYHANIAPGDMMAALLVSLTTVGRQMHPTFSNVKVMQVFAAEADIILQALDKLQSSQGEVKH